MAEISTTLASDPIILQPFNQRNLLERAESSNLVDQLAGRFAFVGKFKRYTVEYGRGWLWKLFNIYAGTH